MNALTDGCAIVTGAGSGLGRALALALSQHMQVAGLGRRMDALEETERLAESSFLPLQADVSDSLQVAQAFDTARNIAPITVLINNAAIYPRVDFLDETPASFMQTVTINLGGMVTCTRAALTDMTATGFGRILNVSTFADLHPLPASSAYAVSKGAARIFTRALIADIGDRFPDIVVNDWMPGMLATGMGIADGLDPATAAEWGAKLALWHDQSLTGTIWEMASEIPPARSLKRRVADRVLMRPRIRPRQL
jgi:NAD(P)-dependent dehydrogenase (short-subunit alcohol dehydrogenase family)